MLSFSEPFTSFIHTSLSVTVGFNLPNTFSELEDVAKLENTI